MSDQSISSLIRSEASSLPVVELLNKPVTILQGVSSTAEDALKSISIETVLDLAASSVFLAATQLTVAGLPDSKLGILGHVPADMIDKDAQTVPLNELYGEDISILKTIGPTSAGILKETLWISTIRDLALWPPYLAAVKILNQVYDLRDSVGSDPESPQELVPRSGQLPTERVQYNVVLFDRILDGQDRSRPLAIIPPGSRRSPAEPLDIEGMTAVGAGPFPIETAGPLDITLATQEFGFTRPALGAILTMTQSWFTHGLALGQLLHTVALAPGESTRIAMIDWSRTGRGTSAEDTTQREQLVSDLTRNRTMSEVINAVATEAQRGFSTASGVGAGTGVGEGGGGAGAVDLTGILPIPLKLGAAGGHSTGWDISGGQAASWASSTGEREIGAFMIQNVLDTTHQASSSVRNRMATKVIEVSENESERVSTRAITNYNHMHALSIQYYEIVQLYRVAVELTHVDACLFIPMKPLDFHNAAVRERFKLVLEAVALIPKAQKQAQVVTNQIAISSPNRIAWDDLSIINLRALFGPSVGSKDSDELTLPLEFYPEDISFSFSKDGESFSPGSPPAPFATLDIEDKDGKVKRYQISKARPSERGPYRAEFGDVFKIDSSKTSPFWDVKKMRLNRQDDSLNWAGVITTSLNLRIRDSSDMWPLQVNIRSESNEGATVILEMKRTSSTSENQNSSDDRELEKHLVENSLYYSQAIWASLDAATLGLLLSNYTLGGRPLIELVDPLPVSMAGNYLAFRMHGQEKSAWWETFLENKGLQVGTSETRKEDLVPMPTGGVFGEAVLGRFNAAEKLDITRFWNWQDSPIPITAPEIAAIATGSRAQPMDLKTGDLNAPIVTISNPPAIPDPQGLTAALTALANSNMFRDMSGLAGTIGFAQAAMQAATQAATTYGQQAGQNAANAADLLAKMYGGGGSGAQGATGSKPSPTSPSTISNAGGRINYGEKLDQQAQGKSSTGGSASGNGAGRLTADVSPGAAKDAFYTDLGNYSGSLPIIRTSGGGDVGSAALKKVTDLVGDVTADGIKNIVSKFIDTPKLVMDKITDGAALLSNYPDPRVYSMSPPPMNMKREIHIRFDNLGGGPFLDGFVGQLNISWVDYCYLQYAAISAADKKRWRALQNIMCKTRLQVVPSGGQVGGAWSNVEIKLDLVVDKTLDEWESEIDYMGNTVLRIGATLLVALKLTPTVGPGGVKFQTIPIPLDPTKGTPMWYIVQDGDGQTAEPFDVLRFSGEPPSLTI